MSPRSAGRPRFANGSHGAPATRLAERRRASGESYVAGGVALNVALDALLVSRDIDVFHDTEAAVAASWEADRRQLEAAGYSAAEVHAMAFDGPPPDAGALSAHWHRILAAAREIVDRLPRAHVGEAVLAGAGDLFRGDAAALARAIGDGTLRFHTGRIGGALPEIVG